MTMAMTASPVRDQLRTLEASFQPRRSKIEAILFDMDGVLIDAREWHYEALNLALRRRKRSRLDSLVVVRRLSF